MSDYSSALTELHELLGELRWLLPDGKWSDAKLKALRVEQCARVLVNICNRENKPPEPVSLKTIYAHISGM